MQKWEYMYANIQTTYDKGKPMVHAVDGFELGNWKKGNTISEWLNQYGAEGWELVTREGASFFFERPKQTAHET